MVCFTRLILNCHSEKDFMANISSGQSMISKKRAWFNSFMYAYQNCWYFKTSHYNYIQMRKNSTLSLVPSLECYFLTGQPHLNAMGQPFLFSSASLQPGKWCHQLPAQPSSGLGWPESPVWGEDKGRLTAGPSAPLGNIGWSQAWGQRVQNIDLRIYIKGNIRQALYHHLWLHVN